MNMVIIWKKKIKEKYRDFTFTNYTMLQKVPPPLRNNFNWYLKVTEDRASKCLIRHALMFSAYYIRYCGINI